MTPQTRLALPVEERVKDLVTRPPLAWSAADLLVAHQTILDLTEAQNALEGLVRTALLTSLLDIRRAAFSPTIGVRCTEAIRADIASACRRLEDHCHKILDDLPPGNAEGPDGS